MWSFNTLRLRQNGQHFADNILKWILLNTIFFIFKKNFIEICFLGFDWQWASTGPDNNVVPNRWEIIIRINDGLVCCLFAYICHSASYTMEKARWQNSYSIMQCQCVIYSAWTSHIKKLNGRYMGCPSRKQIEVFLLMACIMEGFHNMMTIEYQPLAMLPWDKNFFWIDYSSFVG